MPSGPSSSRSTLPVCSPAKRLATAAPRRSRRWPSRFGRTRSRIEGVTRRTGSICAIRRTVRCCGRRRRRPSGRRPRRLGACCSIAARRRRCSTRPRAADGPSVRPTSGPAPRIPRSCRRATMTRAKGRRCGRLNSQRPTSPARSARADSGGARCAISGFWPAPAPDASPASESRVSAGGDLRPGPARHRRTHSRVAAHQERNVRRASHFRRVSFLGSRVRARRGPVRHRVGAPGCAR